MSIHVTDRPSCYIFRCAGCGLLEQATRSDTITCSPACRVLAHRNGAAENVRRMARAARVSPGLIVRCQAILLLRPDLAERCRCGEIEIDDTETRREMAGSFYALILRHMDAHTAPPRGDHSERIGEHHLAHDDALEGG